MSEAICGNLHVRHRLTGSPPTVSSARLDCQPAAHRKAPEEGIEIGTANPVLVGDSCLQDIGAIVVVGQHGYVVVVFEDVIEPILTACGHGPNLSMLKAEACSDEATGQESKEGCRTPCHGELQRPDDEQRMAKLGARGPILRLEVSAGCLDLSARVDTR